MTNLQEHSQEIWKDIYGYEGYYKVSNFGRVKTVPHYIERTNGWKFYCKEKILKVRLRGRKNGKKYVCVKVYINRIPMYHSVHRLVAEEFVPNPNDLPIVNHLDGDTQNNHYTNLQWCTVLENAQHAGMVLGIRDRFKKPIFIYKQGKLDTKAESLSDAAKIINGHRAGIRAYLLGQTTHYKGYTFKLAN